jgi:kynurenine formamidase
MTRYKLVFPLVFSLFVALSCAKEDPFRSGLLIDLTHDFSSETVYWPTSKPFQLETVFYGVTDKHFFYSAYKFCAAEHGGTHIDAPVHFARDHNSVDQIPLEKLIGPAVVIDISHHTLNNREYRINIQDFTAWESSNGRIPDDAIVLLSTGYGRYWPDRVKYMGTDMRGSMGVDKLHFPGLHPDAAKWLIENRKVRAIGIDTPSIDYGQSKLFESHQILSKGNIPIFENVANLDQLPPRGAIVIALPMKIKGGSGGPLRIVALVSNEGN